MTPFETIRLTGGLLSHGESERGLCPWCRGGSTGEKSFVITRDGNNLKYTCFRATCGNNSSGVLNLSGTPVKLSKYKKKPKSREYTHATRMLSVAARVMLFDKFGFTTRMLDEYRIKQDEDGRIVIPLFNRDGVQQGHEVKKGLVDEAGPKAIAYHGHTSDGMAWYIGVPAYPMPQLHKAIPLEDFYVNSLVIVEDTYSAMKANAFMNSLALLGVGLNKEQAQSIAMKNFDTVYIALDADASSKAIQIVKRVRGIIPNVRVMLLKKDIKNMEWDDIAQLFAIHHRRI